MAVGKLYSSLSRAVFCDKDGTLIHDVPYNVDSSRVKLYSDVGKSLKRLQEAGYKLLVVSNQSGIAKELFNADDLEKLWQHIRMQLEEHGVTIEGFYYCPHDLADGCICRKPRPGLISQAAKANRIDLSRSWMIGDILNDVEAGNRAGCRTILIDNGNETQWQSGDFRQPDYKALSISQAVDYILLQDGSERRRYEETVSFNYQKV